MVVWHTDKTQHTFWYAGARIGAWHWLLVNVDEGAGRGAPRYAWRIVRAPHLAEAMKNEGEIVRRGMAGHFREAKAEAEREFTRLLKGAHA